MSVLCEHYDPADDPHPGSVRDCDSFDDLASDQYEWRMVGFTKYGRYAICLKTGIKRGLDILEFYNGTRVIKRWTRKEEESYSNG